MSKKLDKKLRKLQKKVGKLIAKQVGESQPNKKLYCGDKDELPEEYTGFGSRNDCLRKGVGVGLHAKPHVLTTEEILQLLKILKVPTTEFHKIKKRSEILKIILKKINS
jgi:hypothetical protein